MINFYPPYIGAGIKVTDVSKDLTSISVVLKKRWYNRNIYGSHFGGSLYSMVDPFYVFIAYAYFGKGYILWDKSAAIKFISPGRTHVFATLKIDHEKLAHMKNEVDNKGKATFDFETEIVDKKGKLVALVKKEIYIRRKNI